MMMINQFNKTTKKNKTFSTKQNNDEEESLSSSKNLKLKNQHQHKKTIHLQ